MVYHYCLITIATTAEEKTDVESFTAIFFKNHLYLRCLFVNGSRAKFCIIRFALSSTNETENFEVSRESGFLCTTANNQFEAYSRAMVLSKAENGMEQNVTSNIPKTAIFATTLKQYVELTGCQQSKKENYEMNVDKWVFS